MPLLFWLDVSAHAFAGVLAAALALLALGSVRTSTLSRLFLVFISLESLWVGASGLLRLSLWLGRGDPRLFAEVLALALLLMGPTLLIFTAEYVGCRDRRTHWAVGLGIVLAAVLAWPLFSHQIVLTPRLHPSGTTIGPLTPTGHLGAAFVAAYFLAALVLFWRGRSRTGERYLAWSMGVLLAGFVAGIVLSVHVPVTSITQTVSVALLGYGVVSRQIFNPLRARTAELTREIAEHGRTEEALRASEQRFRTIFDSVNDAILVHELNTGRILEVNRRACEMYGCGREELQQLSIADLSANEPPYTQAEALEWITKASGGAPQVFEWQARDRQGRHFWVELAIRRALVGNDERLLVVARDIDERRSEHQQHLDLQTRMFHAQKLESLGVLAGGIAHDFNNLLCGILGFAEIARVEAPAGSRLSERLRRIADAATRAADLCRQLLAYAGRGRMLVEPVDLTALVYDLADLARAAMSKGAELVLDLDPDLPGVEGDAAQLTQIVLNLVVNAAEAMGDGDGRVVVSTGTRRCAQRELADPCGGAELPGGDYVFLRVTDTGVGMSDDTKARLFDPFFTTKFAGRGLGLSAVLGIVRRHHGAIEVESRAGQGSTLTVLIPARPEAPVAARAAAAEMPDWRGSGRVLIIDDEPSARDAGRALLEEMGFDVVDAADGVAGLELFRIHADAIAVVLLDLTMPLMGGEQTLREIRRIRPDARVILMSGYSESEAAARCGPDGPNEYLEKPFRWTQLAAKLRRAMA